MRFSAACTASTGGLPAAISSVTRKAATSESVSVAKRWPLAASSSRSALKFSMIPLCTTASRSLACGWALLRSACHASPSGYGRCRSAAERRALELGLEVLQLALGAQPRQPAALQRRDARRVVAAIFEPLQRRDDLRRDRALSQNADDSAHCPIPGRPIRRPARVRPAARAGSSHVGCANVTRGDSEGRAPSPLAGEGEP